MMGTYRQKDNPEIAKKKGIKIVYQRTDRPEVRPSLTKPHTRDLLDDGREMRQSDNFIAVQNVVYGLVGLSWRPTEGGVTSSIVE